MYMKQTIMVAGLVVALLANPVQGLAEGRETLVEEEKKINVSSYNPTQPEIQLGYTSKLSIDESGTVLMDTEAIQSNLNSDGLVYIEAVKGVEDIYYVIEKGGYVLSIQAKNNRLVSDDGAIVQIQLVDWLYGRNGLADDDGFKSNIVPDGFLPKTGVSSPTTEDMEGENTHETDLDAVKLFFVYVQGLLLLGVISLAVFSFRVRQGDLRKIDAELNDINKQLDQVQQDLSVEKETQDKD